MIFMVKESYNFKIVSTKFILHKCKKLNQRFRFIRMFLFKVEKIAAFYVKIVNQVSET